jgi:quinol monooxygenase YgiN
MGSILGVNVHAPKTAPKILQPEWETLMVHATIRMVIAAKEQGEVLQILRSIAERTRLEQGCIGCHVYQAAEEELAIMIEELWKSEEDLERHLRSEEYRKLLLLVEMALQPPEIRFNVISRSTGVETIEKARDVIP